MKNKITIGTRGSELALWQANYIHRKLAEVNVEAEIKVISTKGDQVQDLSFDKMEGKGFFTKEIEEALIKKEIDLAVHSHKDLETAQPKGLVIAAATTREEANDVLLIHKKGFDQKRKLSLKQSALVGTSSARRKSLLKGFRKDVEIKDLRGNVPTRIEKLRNGEYDAIVLAAAGINRLEADISDLHLVSLDPTDFIPAPAQGVLALQIREDDQELREVISQLNDEDSNKVSSIERQVLAAFDGGCQLPIGVYCCWDEDEEKHKIWTAVSKSWKSPPQFIYMETSNPSTIASRIKEKFKNIQPTTVYITRDIRPDDCFETVLTANGFQVEGKSLIETKRVEIIKEPRPYSWVFFSSKQAIWHFFKQSKCADEIKYGVIGKSTAEALRKHDKKPDFIGYSTDTRLTGRQFAATVGSGRVLFPQARGSMRAIQQQFINQEQVIDLAVYETISHAEVEIAAAEILVFTSPSNVVAYFKRNKIKQDQKVIAMGHATGKALKNYNVHQFTTPASFMDTGLAAAVFLVSTYKKHHDTET
ncbi:MAG TPA: hydroxymethylbilane synthase [Flavobacteriales bacterium]|nr:hydroxymethylbilane synthase [Flavobacteriales bacterium]